jgi:putative transposase
VHFHTLVAQGVFVEQADGSRRFLPLPGPTDDDIARLLVRVRRRIIRLVRRHGIDREHPSHESDPDQLRLYCPVLAEIQGAAVAGRVATGPRAGARVQRLGREPAVTGITVNGALHAHIEGFDLHAAVTAPAGDRARLEHLCRYVLRPPIAQDALDLAPDGSVLVRLRRAFRDGTRVIRLEPPEFLEKLASMIPKPRINLLVYHGAFAPHARGRDDAVRAAREATAATATATTVPNGDAPPRIAITASLGAVDPPRATQSSPAIVEGRCGAADSQSPGPSHAPPRPGYTRPRYHAWADLLRRTFAADVLACAHCGRRLRLLATITDERVIRRLLRHLGLPTEVPEPAPARPSGWSADLDPAPLSSA